MRFGVLGTGHWARTTHGTALAEHPEVELVGFWGRDAGNAQRAADECGGTAFTDVDDLLAEVDAVAVALPPDVQADLAVRAAQRGRHLLLDKPLATTLENADAVVRAVQENGVASIVYLTYLFQPDITDWLGRMRDLATEHGPWEGGVFRWAGTIDAPGNPYGNSPWRRQRGGLWDSGPHALSILRPVFGDVERVSAGRGPRDAVVAAFEHASGAGTSLSVTATAPEGTGGSFATIWGPGGRHDLPRFTGTAQEGFRRAVDRLRDAARTGRPDALDVVDARETVAVLAAVEEHLARPDRATAVAHS
ncbi:Gfo/Idh/MocA family protein [Kineococcus sp. SYSU DK003]|uniref:Gfo/Idh/MocA family protein n=1 Tax=Kineococcus sp. SYSU DK003 TaxID=3383124 RepID=UPI003D7E6B4D